MSASLLAVNLNPLLKGIVYSLTTFNYAALLEKGQQLAALLGIAKEEAAVEALIHAATNKDAAATLDAVADLLKLVALRLPSAGQIKIAAAVGPEGHVHLQNHLDEAFGPVVVGDPVPVDAIGPGQILAIIRVINLIVAWIPTLKKVA